MPATFTHSPAETERKEPGIGGKPPLDRRPTGGGGAAVTTIASTNAAVRASCCTKSVSLSSQFLLRT